MGFEAEAERLMRKKREREKVKLAERCGTRVGSVVQRKTTFLNLTTKTTWDEYERVVLGEDDDDANNEESKLSEEDKKLLQDVASTLQRPMLTQMEPCLCWNFSNLPQRESVSRNCSISRQQHTASAAFGESSQ